MGEEFYTIKQAAEILNVNPATIRRRIKSGELKAVLIEGVYGNQYMIPTEQINPSTQPIAYTDVVQTTRQITMSELEGVISHSIQRAIQPL